MFDQEDKKVDAKVEGVDVSGYVTPEFGGMSPYPPGYCPPAPSPTSPDPGEINFARAIRMLKNQQVTVYIMGMSPVAPVPVVPAGGGAVVPGSGPFGITGMIHMVGEDYLVLHVMLDTMRVVYIPFSAVSAVVPGGPLIPGMEPNVTTTLPGTL